MLGLSLAIAPSAQAKEKKTKPSAPTLVSITYSTPKNFDPDKDKVSVRVEISLPESSGGSKITGSKISISSEGENDYGSGTKFNRSCTTKGSRTSCTIKGVPFGYGLYVSARSKNKKGYGPKSAEFSFIAGCKYTDMSYRPETMSCWPNGVDGWTNVPMTLVWRGTGVGLASVN